MSCQPSISTVNVMIRVKAEDAERLNSLSEIESQKSGHRVSMAAIVTAMLHERLAGVEVSESARAWSARRREKAILVRRKADMIVATGKYRKEGWQDVDRRRMEKCAREESRRTVSQTMAA